MEPDSSQEMLWHHALEGHCLLSFIRNSKRQWIQLFFFLMVNVKW